MILNKGDKEPYEGILDLADELMYQNQTYVTEPSRQEEFLVPNLFPLPLPTLYSRGFRSNRTRQRIDDITQHTSKKPILEIPITETRIYCYQHQIIFRHSPHRKWGCIC